MVWYRAFAKLRHVSASEFLDLIRAQWAIVLAQAAVWTRSRGDLLRVAESEAASEPEGDQQRAAQLATAVARAARYGVLRPHCLVKALALHRLLTRKGVRGSRVRIGVRKQGDELLAHAWVVWGSTVLGDDPARVSQFATMTDGSAVTRL